MENWPNYSWSNEQSANETHILPTRKQRWSQNNISQEKDKIKRYEWNGQDEDEKKNLSRKQDLVRSNMAEPQYKMKKRFQGPYAVSRKIDGINYRVNTAKRRRKKTQVGHMKKKKGALYETIKYRSEVDKNKRRYSLVEDWFFPPFLSFKGEGMAKEI